MKEQLAVLSRLRMDMERQMQALAGAAPDEETAYRHEQLEQSLVQLDEQIKAAQEQINARMRAVRLLEAAPSRNNSASAF